MDIVEIQNEIVEEFSVFDDWLEKYEYLMEFGAGMPRIAEDRKTESNLIRGCQSRVWLDAEMDSEGRIQFSADSDALITQGIVALLLKVLNNRTPDEIINSDLFFLEKIGLKENLSPTRANGLLAMLKQMKLYAIAFSEIKK